MATALEKNTKKLIERKLDALFSKQQKLNGNVGGNPEGMPKAAGGWDGNVPNLPGQNRVPYWPQGGQTALNTIYNNYVPNMYGGQLPNVNVTAQGYNSINNPISLPEANVVGTRTAPKNIWDRTGRNPYNFYNNQAPTGFTIPQGTAITRPDVAQGVNPTVGGVSQATPTAGRPADQISPMAGVGFNPMQPMAFDPNYQASKVSASGNSYLANANNPNGTGGSVLDQPNYGNRPGLDTAAKTDWSKAGAFVGQIAPMVYNMAKGLQRPDKATPNYNPYESQIRSLMANRRFNIDPLLNANLTANAVNNRNIRNVAGSRGELMGNLTASQNARMNADMSAWSTKTNQDNQYMAEQAQMDANLGANRAAMDWNVQDANARNKAATNQFMGQGLNDLSQFSQVQQQMKNQKFRDAQLASLYPDMYSQIYQFQPFMQEIVGAAKLAGGIK